MKKNKMMMWIILAVAAVFIIAAGAFGKQYYDDRYVGADYYTMVPLDYDMTPDTMYNMNGGVVGSGKWYKLTAYNEQGEAKEVEFKVMGEDSASYPPPGTYLYVQASKQLVVSWSVISEQDVPAGALAKIK